MKRDRVSTISTRRLVTIPVAVLRALGVQPSGKAAFQIEEGEVRLMPAAFTLAAACASVEPLQRPEDAEQGIRDAKDETAARTARVRRDERQDPEFGSTAAGCSPLPPIGR